MPTAVLAVTEAHSTASDTTKPVLAGRDNTRFLGPIELDVQRAAKVGGATVWGANLPNIAAGDTKYCRQIGSDGATGRTVFTTTIPFVAFANYNLVVLVNGLVIQQGAGAGKFTLSNVGGFAVVTLGTAIAINDVIESFGGIVPVALMTYATTAVQFKQAEVQGYDLLWYVSDATVTPSETNVYAHVIGE